MQKTRIPIEIAAGLLAFLTPLFTIPPLNMPIWAIFITWGATFLLGSPNWEGVKKMCPPLIFGTIMGVIASLLFGQIPGIAGNSVALGTLCGMIIVGVVTIICMYFGKVPGFAVIPNMFIGVAAYLATAAGGFGLLPHGILNFWFASTLMLCLGPFFAWGTIKLTMPVTVAAPEGQPVAQAK